MKKYLIGGARMRELGSDRSTQDTDFLINEPSRKLFTTDEDGKQVEYGDCIHSTTKIYLSWLLILRAIFGRPVICYVQIYTKEEVNVLKTTSRAYADPIFKRRESTGGMLELAPETNEPNRK